MSIVNTAAPSSEAGINHYNEFIRLTLTVAKELDMLSLICSSRKWSASWHRSHHWTSHKTLLQGLLVSLSLLGGFCPTAWSFTNLLANPSFEYATSGLWGGSIHIASNARSGTMAVLLDNQTPWGGGLEVQVNNLTPNTRYTFSAWVKSPQGTTGYVGVKHYGAEARQMAFNSAQYTEVGIEFTTGETHTQATVYIYNPPNEAGILYADDLRLVAVPATGPELLADGGFEQATSLESLGLWGGSQRSNNNVKNGSYAAILTNNAIQGGGVEFTLEGLTAGEHYQFSLWVNNPAGTSAFIGVKEHGTEQTMTPINTGGYHQITLDFTPQTDSAALFIYLPPTGAGTLNIDELSVTAIPATPDFLTDIQTHYQLMWFDEFNQTGAVSPERWHAETGFKRNFEEQWYQEDNAHIDAGKLVVKAQRETHFPNPNYNPQSSDWRQSRAMANWTSASINTSERYLFTYGIVEVRAKISNLMGAWPAIWMVGADSNCSWPANGEIDIMENYQGRLLGNFAVAAAGMWQANWSSRSIEVAALNDPTWAQRYHLWHLYWDENRLAIYLDGTLLNELDLHSAAAYNSTGASTCPGINPFHKPHWIWLNLAIGGSAGGNTSDLPESTEFWVDYVRIYQQP